MVVMIGRKCSKRQEEQVQQEEERKIQLVGTQRLVKGSQVDSLVMRD